MYTEIKDLNQSEIIKLNLRTLVWLKYKVVKNPRQKKIFNIIKESLGYQGKANYDNEIWMLVNMLVSSVKTNKDGCWFPRRTEAYSGFNSKYNNKFKITRDKMCRVVDDLEQQGMLDMYSGFWNPFNEDESITSRVVFKEYLLGLVDTSMLNNIKDPLEDLPEIEVNVKIKEGKVYKKILLDNVGKMKNATLKRRNVKLFNDFLYTQDIELDGVKYLLRFKRVYRDNLCGCGRWYEVGTFQTAEKEARKRIKINGEYVTEVDISSIHPNLIAAYNNVDLGDKDPYGVYDPDLVEIFKGKDNFRAVCKIAVMCMINCKTKRGSWAALKNHLVKHKDETGLNIPEDDNVFKKVINALVEHNKKVDFFGKETLDFKVLQNIDSEICEQVLLRCKAAGFLALPYHDSWCVGRQYRDQLIEIIKKAWFSVVGSMLNFKYKIEF